MKPPACECGHALEHHADAHGYLGACTMCGTGGCAGYLGHSTLVLEP